MGILKWLCRKFKCESSCMFNEQEFNMAHHHQCIGDYQLKHKDIEKIHKILNKRPLKCTLTNVNEMIDI